MQLKETELDSHATYSVYSGMDAMRRSSNNASRYLTAQKTEAARVQQGLSLCYTQRPIYVTYRTKFIAVKVTGQVRDRAMLRSLEEEYAQRGYTKVNTPQGVIYRIPKAS